MQASEAERSDQRSRWGRMRQRASRREPGCSYVEHGLPVRLAVLRVAAGAHRPGAVSRAQRHRELPQSRIPAIRETLPDAALTSARMRTGS